MKTIAMSAWRQMNLTQNLWAVVDVQGRPMTVDHPGGVPRLVISLFASDPSVHQYRQGFGLDAEVRTIAQPFEDWMRSVECGQESFCVRVFTDIEVWVVVPDDVSKDGYVEANDVPVTAFRELGIRGFAQVPPTMPVEQPGEGAGTPNSSEHRRCALLRDGTMVARLHTERYTTDWGAKTLFLESVGGVVTAPEARRTGATRELMQNLCRSMREQGIALSAITTPFSYQFYRKMGWEYGFTRPYYQFSPRLLSGLDAGHGEAMLWDANKDPFTSTPVDLEAVYLAALQTRYQGFAHRTPKLWRRHLQGPKTYTYLWYDGSGPSGYVTVRAEEDRWVITELLTCDQNALLGLLGLVRNFDSQADLMEWDALPEVRLDRWLNEPALMTTQYRPQGMFRLIDLQQALIQRSYKPELSLTIDFDVTDELCPWNEGTWQLTIAHEAASVERLSLVPSKGTRTFDIRVLSLLYLGLGLPQGLWGGIRGNWDPVLGQILEHVFAGPTPLLLEEF